jgi:hypothetical protein
MAAARRGERFALILSGGDIALHNRLNLLESHCVRLGFQPFTAASGRLVPAS